MGNPEMQSLEKKYLELNSIQKDLARINEVLYARGIAPGDTGDAIQQMVKKKKDLNSAMDEYKDMLLELRNNPVLLKEWVDKHVDIYSGLKDSELLGEDFNITRRHVIKQAIEEWKEVLDGKRECVFLNPNFTAEVEDLLAKEFGL